LIGTALIGILIWVAAKAKAKKLEKRITDRSNKKKTAQEKRLDSMTASIAEVKRREAERKAKRKKYLRSPEGKRREAERKAKQEAKKRAEHKEREKREAEREELYNNLTDISGVSGKVARTLMDKFKTLQSIERASAKNLTSIPGVGMNLAEAIKRRIGYPEETTREKTAREKRLDSMATSIAEVNRKKTERKAKREA